MLWPKGHGTEKKFFSRLIMKSFRRPKVSTPGLGILPKKENLPMAFEKLNAEKM